ncbi:proteophosphoglycan ppg4 [Rhodotorula toruloides]|uniref:Proteophosphoglycan ppg4 n=1 Tax=Rhodotorula toruloides TaxID=5286 RepID=A0A511K8R6_RHOTO|nr:proteophosphoglycan ppg4 [Rhodotorula toruloides]
MPLRTYKKQRTDSNVSSTPATSPAVSSKSSSSPHRSVSNLPKEVLARVPCAVSDTTADGGNDARSDLLSLASTCSARRAAAIPFFDFSVRLDGWQAVVKLGKVFGQKTQSSDPLPSLGKGVHTLKIEFESLYSSNPPTFSTLSSSITRLFPMLAGLSILSISLPTHESLAKLFTENGMPWPFALQILALDVVRGDCNSHSPFAANPSLPCKLRKVALHSSTLTDGMIAHLFAGQTSLKELDLTLPGAEVWMAFEKVVTNVDVLRVRDSWASTAGQRVTKKGNLEARDHEESHEKARSPTSPLLPLLKAAKALETVLLTLASLPSLPPTAESSEELLPYLAVVENLELEGFSLISPLFVALETALNKQKLPSLERNCDKGHRQGQEGTGSESGEDVPEGVQ